MSALDILLMSVLGLSVIVLALLIWLLVGFIRHDKTDSQWPT